MGYRFYMQQLEALGSCPGYRSTTKRKRKMAWDDDKKAAVIAAYEEQNPTPENSMEIVKEIADEFDESPNGVRMILSKAGVYVKKTPAASGSGTSSGGGSSRVSKAAAQEALVAVLTDVGAEIDNDIVEKLTGKAAQYFAGVIGAINS
jgi:transposase-like protein